MKIGAWTLPLPIGPYEWEQREDDEHGDQPKRAIFASPRMGKTNAVALTLRRRAVAGLWTRAVVVAPLKVCPTWMDVLQQAGLPVTDVFALPVAKMTALAKSSWEGVLVVNRDKLADLEDALKDLDVFIVDESHNYAAVGSGRAKAYRRLARRTPYVRILTGTPVPRHYGSLWSQLAPLSDAWETSFEKFAQRFLIRDAMFKSRVIGHINVEELRARVLRVASIYRREDVFGPDQFIPYTRYVTLPERAEKLYRRLAREWVLDEPDIQVDAVNAAVRLVRLQQLTSGYLPTGDPDGEEHASMTMVHQAKIDALIGDLDEIFEQGEKVVVWHRFTPEGNAVYAEIRLRYPSVPIYKLDGTSDTDEAYNDMQRFNAVESAACFVVQIQAGGEGTKFSSADHAMYLSRTFSFTDDEQSRDRIYEIGKPRTIGYYEVENSVDGFVAELLEGKLSIHMAIRNCDRESLVYGPLKRRKKVA